MQIKSLFENLCVNCLCYFCYVLSETAFNCTSQVERTAAKSEQQKREIRGPDQKPGEPAGGEDETDKTEEGTDEEEGGLWVSLKKSVQLLVVLILYVLFQ